MKSVETLKTILLLCLVLITGFFAWTYHQKRYQAVSVGDRLYLVDERTGATFYPAPVGGTAQWKLWVPSMEGDK